MKVYFIKEFKDIPKNISNLNLVLGLFDGIHIGHQELINFACKNSSNEVLGVFTFDKALKNTTSILMNVKDKLTELEKLPIDYLFVLVCDENIRTMSHEIFLEKVIKGFNPKKIFCGPDFRFGYKALGDVDYLKENFDEVFVFDFVKDDDGQKISTSLIKELIANGNIEKANKLLTREYKINGTIVSGYRAGHLLGFPTANIKPLDSYLLPHNGVYFTRIIIDNNAYFAVTNIGLHPTINELKSPIIEAHILNCDTDLYGKTIELYIYKKERDELKFDNVESLKKQILKDRDNCIKYFQNLGLHK